MTWAKLQGTTLITADPSGWRVASLSHTTSRWVMWYRPRDKGYAAMLHEAGLYPLDLLLDSPMQYAAWDLLCVPDYVANRLANVSGLVRSSATTWASLRLAALYLHPEPHPGPCPPRQGRRGSSQ